MKGFYVKECREIAWLVENYLRAALERRGRGESEK